MATFPVDKLRMVDAVTDPIAVLGSGKVYAKTVSGVVQLFYRASDGTITPLSPAASPMLVWGALGVDITTVPRYLYPGYTNAIALSTPLEFEVPRAGVLSTLRIYHATRGGGTAILSYTLQVNGAATALVASSPANQTLGPTNLVDTVAVNAGDRVGIIATKAAAITTSPNSITATIQFAST